MMILVAARRLWANRRLAAGLLLGFAVAVAAAASVPIFAAVSLQRVLQSDLRAAKERQPASVHMAWFAKPNQAVTAKQFLEADQIARESGRAMLGMPVEPFVRYGATELGAAVPEDRRKVNPNKTRWMSLAFQTGLEEQITLIDGRLPKPGRQPDGSLEVLVEEATLEKQDFTVGARLILPLGKGDRAPKVTVSVVGAFQRLDPLGAYWFQGNPFEQHLFISEESFRQEILPLDGVTAGQYSWFYGVASESLRVVDAIPFLSGMYNLEARMAQALPGTELFGGPMELLTRFAYRAADLRLMLLLLAVPPLAVVAYFIVVTSGMIVDGQRQEIAVLRSRGAGLSQILFVYVLEGLLLAGLAMLLGLPLGLWLARLMGSAVGFLSFVNRTLPALQLSTEFWLYGAAAALLAVLAYVLPAVGAARQSIIAYKQESARGRKGAAWARLGLDAILLGLAGYAYYTMQGARGMLASVSEGEALGRVEPLHLLAPALFIIGAGLLLLRLVPLLGRLAALAADRWARAPLYLALTQIGRAPSSYLPVVFLLTLTVGMGLYSASAARTVERNTTDRLLYASGADVILDEAFEFEEEEGSEMGSGEGQYIAPPWELHYSLPGVVHPARVRLEEVTPSVGGRAQRKGQLMAIDPQDFGRVAWFRPDLAPVHFYDFLNQLARDEEAVLVNTEFLRRNKLNLGDRISLMGTQGQEVSLVIYGTVDYWPTLYPRQTDIFIANYDFIESYLGLKPYQVWLRMEAGAKLQPVIDALKAQSVLTLNAADTRQKLIGQRRDPTLNGLMGGLTTGFLLSAALTLLGFWLHAALNARSRLLQFGVLRAIGLTGTQLSGAVILEQALAVLMGVGAGTGLGLLAAGLFIPFLQQGADAASQTPPFLVISAAGDRVRMYLVLLLMVAISMGGLWAYLSRLRIAEAVKLGEDH